MSSALAFAIGNPGVLLTIVSAGLACGTLDIIAAFVVYIQFGRPPLRLLQGIAAGVLGKRAFEGGMATAWFGLFCHYFIAFSAATVYFTASRSIAFVLEHAVISGAAYGVIVYFFMNRIVVPLSGTIKLPFSFKMMVIGIVIHIFCVGLPIAIVVERFSIN
jgi:uncharacterized membrane protein YagU involved in acid resistance